MSTEAYMFVWRRIKVKGAKKLMMLALAEFANKETGECYPSIGTLAKMLCISERNASAALSGLAKDKLIEIRHHEGMPTGTGNTNRYYLIGFKEWVKTLDKLDDDYGKEMSKSSSLENEGMSISAVRGDEIIQQGMMKSSGKPVLEPEYKPESQITTSHSDNDATASYIKAWLEGQSTQPAINQYGNKTNRNIAKQLANAGIPKEKVTAFTKHLAAQPYWKGKLVPITTVGNDIAAWLSSAAAPAPINPAHVKIEPVADHDAPDRELIETTIADLAKRFSVKDEVQRVPTNIEAA